MKILKDKNRIDLAKLFHGRGVEVGVEQGIFSEQICLNAPVLKLYCVDAWKPYRAYRDHTSVGKLERFYWRTRKRLHKYGCRVIRETSVDAAKGFTDGSLDFVYIDANHAYEFVMKDLKIWWPKLKPGGIMAGHDYLDLPERKQFYDVIGAVNDFVKENNIEDLTIFAAEEHPSFMFKKTL